MMKDKFNSSKGPVPDALKNLGSKNHIPPFNNQKQSSTENGDNLEEQKSATDQIAEKAVEKGGSAALQASGVPKPLADAVSKKLAGPVVKKAKKAIKIKIIISLIGTTLFILAIMFIVSVFKMLSIDNVFQYISDKASEVGETISVGLGKTVNLLTGQGWTTEDEAYNNSLQNQYNNFHKSAAKSGELDLALIAATINYGRVINPDIWTKDTTIENITSECNNPDNPSSICAGEIDNTGIGIDKGNSKAFYQWANIWVGNMYTMLPWNRGLTGALVSSKVSLVCVEEKPSLYDKFINGPGAFLDYGWKILWGTVWDASTDVMKIVTGDIYRDMSATHETTDNFNSVDTILNMYYSTVVSFSNYDQEDSESNIEMFGYDSTSNYNTSGVDKNLNCPKIDKITGQDSHGDNIIQQVETYPTTKFTVYNDYNKYKAYLKKFFIPRMYLDCGNCSRKNYDWEDGEKEEYIDNIIKEIFHEKDAYNLLAGITTYDENGNPITDITYGDGQYTSSICGINTTINLPNKAQCAAGVRNMGSQLLASDPTALAKFNQIAGNGVDYWTKNAALGVEGFKTSSTPIAGSLAVWSGGNVSCSSSLGGKCGHVLLVVGVNDDETLNIMECNYDGNENCRIAKVSQAKIVNYTSSHQFLGYIHLLGDNCDENV